MPPVPPPQATPLSPELAQMFADQLLGPGKLPVKIVDRMPTWGAGSPAGYAIFPSGPRVYAERAGATPEILAHEFGHAQRHESGKALSQPPIDWDRAYAAADRLGYAAGTGDLTGVTASAGELARAWGRSAARFGEEYAASQRAKQLLDRGFYQPVQPSWLEKLRNLPYSLGRPAPRKVILPPGSGTNNPSTELQSALWSYNPVSGFPSTIARGLRRGLRQGTFGSNLIGYAVQPLASAAAGLVSPHRAASPATTPATPPVVPPAFSARPAF